MNSPIATNLLASVLMKKEDLKQAIQYLEESGSLTIQSLEDWQLDGALASCKAAAKTRRTQRAASLIAPENRCLARIWKGECGTEGVGSQCKKQAKDGCFCGMHGRLGTQRTKHSAVPEKERPYTWEHHGKWDEPPPAHFKNRECWASAMTQEPPTAPPTTTPSPKPAATPSPKPTASASASGSCGLVAPSPKPTETATPEVQVAAGPTQEEVFGSDDEDEINWDEDEEETDNFEIKIDAEGISWKVKTDGSNEAFEMHDDDLEDVAGTWNEEEQMVE